MRVAIVAERYEFGRGGATRAAYELVQALADRGDLDLTVFCREVLSDPPPKVKLRTLPVPSFWQPLRVFAFSRAVAQATRDYDVVQTSTRTRHQHIFRAEGGVHQDYIDRTYRWPSIQRLSPRHISILQVEEAVFHDETQIIQCCSRFVADSIRDRYGIPETRLEVIYHGVDRRLFNPERRQQRRLIARQALNLNRPAALFAGHGFERKGLRAAIDGLADSGADAELIVAGRARPGPFARYAQRRGVGDRVRFVGAPKNVADLLAACDVLVLPTRYDAFGVICLEAMASGLPVATTPFCGAAELIDPGRSGWISEHDFTPCFRVLETPDELAAMGAAAHEQTASLTWEAHAERVVQLYARVLAA